MGSFNTEAPTIVEIFDEIEKKLPSSLVTDEEKSGLRSAANTLLPSKSGLSIECRLSDGETRCDFLSMIYRKEMLEWRMPAHLIEALGLQIFFREWANSDSSLEQIAAVALECDVVGGKVYPPFVSATIEPDFEQGAEVVLTGKKLTRVDTRHGISHRNILKVPKRSSEGVAQAFLRCIGTDPLPRRLVETLDRCFEALTSHGCIYHVSSQFNRAYLAQPVVRIIVSLPVAQVVDYLIELDWPGDRQHLTRLLPMVLPHTHRANFDVYVHEGWIDPVIGLYMQYFAPRPHEQRWQQSYAWLLSLSTCSQAKIKALHDWVRQAEQAQNYRQELGLKIKLGNPGKRDNNDPDIKAYLSYLPRRRN